MIPYEIVIASACRPHLLGPVLTSLFQYVDQMPARLILHDDVVFQGRQEAVQALLAYCVPKEVPVLFKQDDPPLRHGPSLAWMLDQVGTEYVLYSQDDHVVVRPLPVRAALATLHEHGLSQIRFNKRPTMAQKGEGAKAWRKVECRFGETILTVADHWYFQTGCWRVAPLKTVVDWFMGRDPLTLKESAEIKINHAMNGQIAEFNDAKLLRVPVGVNPLDQGVRREIQRTFIWGGIGEPQFIHHVGGDPKDWALERVRIGR